MRRGNYPEPITEQEHNMSYAFETVITADAAIIAAEGASSNYAKAMLSNAADIVATLAPNGVGKRGGTRTPEQTAAMRAAKDLYLSNGVGVKAADQAVTRMVNVAALIVAHPDARKDDREAWVLEVRAFVMRGASAADLKAARETKAADPVKAVKAAAKRKQQQQRGAGKQTGGEKTPETPDVPVVIVVEQTPAELGEALTVDYLKAVTALLAAHEALESALKSGKATVTKQQATGRETRNKAIRAALAA